jgi:hypothetical protein
VAKKTDAERLKDKTFTIAQSLTLQGYAVSVTYNPDGTTSDISLRRRGKDLGILRIIFDYRFVGDLRFQPHFVDKELGTTIVQITKKAVGIL